MEGGSGLGALGWGEPSGGVGGEVEGEAILEVGETFAEVLPIAPAGLDERGEALHLLPSDGGLDVEGLEVVAEVGVDVLVIVAFGQLAELPGEALTAGIVDPARAPAVAAPVAEAFHIGLEALAAHDVHGPPPRPW